MLQMVIGLQDLIIENPELASYEVHVVDDKNSKEIGITPVGKALYHGQDDARKVFDIYTNVREEDLEEENMVDKFSEYTEQSSMVQLLRNIHFSKQKLDRYLNELVIRYEGDIMHKFKCNVGDDNIICRSARTGREYNFTWYSLITVLQDGRAEIL